MRKWTKEMRELHNKNYADLSIYKIDKILKKNSLFLQGDFPTGKRGLWIQCKREEMHTLTLFLMRCRVCIVVAPHAHKEDVFTIYLSNFKILDKNDSKEVLEHYL
jgi:hypothetical protein